MTSPNLHYCVSVIRTYYKYNYLRESLALIRIIEVSISSIIAIPSKKKRSEGEGFKKTTLDANIIAKIRHATPTKSEEVLFMKRFLLFIASIILINVDFYFTL